MERDSKKLMKKLEADGWELVRKKGSHHHFKHPASPHIITVKHPERNLTIGQLKSIYKLAGWR